MAGRIGASTLCWVVLVPGVAPLSHLAPPLASARRVRGGALPREPLLPEALGGGGGGSARRRADDWRRRRAMYASCATIVLLWVGGGTLFYARHNGWPLAQAFFYAVDAGMSIGFCTEVAETTVSSRAFTIVFILLGASVVGGALALFVEDAVAGAASAGSAEYRRLLEREAFRRADADADGVLSYAEFVALLRWAGYGALSDEQARQVCRKFDASGDGAISYREFLASYPGLAALVRTSGALYSRRRLVRWAARAAQAARGLAVGRQRVCKVHFAVSALATGGLTAPPVDAATGTMRTADALFTGGYCLFGIPLFALTLGHYARALVERHVVAAERGAIAAPLRAEEYDLARSLCSAGNGQRVGVAEFVLLHLLRQGRVGLETVTLLRRQFAVLDRDGSGALSLEEATRPLGGCVGGSAAGAWDGGEK